VKNDRRTLALFFVHRITAHTLSNALKVKRFNNVDLRCAASRRCGKLGSPPAGFMMVRQPAGTTTRQPEK